ncbi:hypothetical protein [Stenotrophomonas sp. PS02301]|uniref:hypothetical protein n=1 Tax=Stenotrophomonas sp. PS02301 TaxID=2991427 RepID=UPI00249B79A3|nr:hypothetical protein [Stenotrophomonas sp. PS02301]
MLHENELTPLPEGWVWKRSDDLVTKLKPGKLFDSRSTEASGEVPVLNQSEHGYLGFHDEEAGVQASPSNPVATFANHTCAMRLVKRPFSCIQNIFPKIGIEGISDTAWFYYAMQGRVRISEYKGHHPLYREAFVPTPPLSTQRRIASILAAYDDLIENNTRRIAILEEMARRIYEDWFVHFRFPGHDNVRMVESELGLVPERWAVTKASTAIHINPQTKVAKDGIKPFVAMNCLSDASMLIGKPEQRTGNSGSKFRNDDTLFARITPCLENGKTGFVQFLPDAESAAFGSTEFIVLRSHSLTPEFVYLLARSTPFRDNAIKSMSGASGRQRVRDACFDTFMLTQPDARTLRAFGKKVQPMFRLIQTLAMKNANLRTIRDLLLPKLISGELDVSATPEPEAAAA